MRRATFLGPTADYEMEVGGTTLLAVDPDWMGRGLHEPGEEVTWSLRPEQAYALPPVPGDEPAPEDADAA